MNFSFLQTALTFFLIFTVLVFFHELGHFLTAKLCRMKVEEFGFGLPLPFAPFNKRICRYAFDGETEYTVWPFLFGGFVRIAGMEIDQQSEPVPSKDEEAQPGEAVGTTNVHTLRQEAAEVDKADTDGFNTRPIPQRFAVILAGPVFSFLLGWIVLCLIGVTVGIPTKSRLTVGEFSGPKTVAQAAGLKPGDAIIGFNGKTAEDAGEILDAIHGSGGKTLTLMIEDKNKQTRTVTVVPESKVIEPGTPPVGLIGIKPNIQETDYHRVSLGESFQAGNRMVGLWFSTIGRLTKSGEIKDNVGGPIAIVNATHDAAQNGMGATMMLLGTLSLSLGLFNLIPIPILDGGHLLLMFVEAIRGRKLSAEAQGRVLTFGFAVLAVLFVLIMFKDISGLFRRG